MVDGASSIAGTQQIRENIVRLFNTHHIQSIFDAGCNDCHWIQLVVEQNNYQGGDISPSMIHGVKQSYPELDVIVHDITTDPLPKVDLLLVRDVAIHLSNEHKRGVWNNWLNSKIPWILITHWDCDEFNLFPNKEIDYTTAEFPFSNVNWETDPRNFPPPIDIAMEYQQGKCLGLWNQHQFKGIQ
jgi:hypothetical protein